MSHHLPKGEHKKEGYVALNPQGLVPALELDDGTILTQSLAIIEWLDETHPKPPLLPAEPLRAPRSGRSPWPSPARSIRCRASAR